MSDPMILVVDDEAAIRDMVGVALDTAGFRSMSAESAHEALIAVVDSRPDLVLLDWMLPGRSGIELARRLKQDELTASIPIIMLTAKTSEDNKVQGLDVGVDDYVTKPFSPRELVARIRAVLRRTSAAYQERVLKATGLELDLSRHRLMIEEMPVEIGPTEFRLLAFFMEHPEKVFTREHIQNQVWGANVYLEERTVDVHIGRLRKILSGCGNTRADYSALVQTVRGTGYRFSTRTA
jgi:two-component system, OmpR family, phosphate regulon response regulator PhoB